MYYSVIAICENRSELWCENKIFVESFIKFRSKIPQIKQCIDILTMENIINESFKTIDRIELEEAAFYLIGKMLTFAQQTNKENLYSELNYEKMNLSHCSDLELIGTCNTLSKVSADNFSALQDLNISVENIAELQHLTSTFSINYTRAKSSRIKSKTTEEKLKKLFKDCDELLRQRLDKDIEFFKNSEPEFYSEYLASRAVFEVEGLAQKEHGNISNVLN